MQRLVSVIIPAYNEQDSISDCLDSVLNQATDPELYEIILVDNASTDATAKIARDKGVRVISEQKKGYVYAIRKGVEVSEGAILAFTDADCRVPFDWLSKILEYFEKYPGIVAVGGKLSFYDLNPWMGSISRAILYFADALPGNNMAIKKEALQRMGGINPHINLSVDYWLTINLKKVGPIKITHCLVVATSGRRFTGAFVSHLYYLVNVISLSFFNRPMFFDFPDVR